MKNFCSDLSRCWNMRYVGCWLLVICGTVIWFHGCPINSPVDTDSPAIADGASAELIYEQETPPEVAEELLPDDTTDTGFVPEQSAISESVTERPADVADLPTAPDADRAYGLTKRVANTTCRLIGQPESLRAMRVTPAFPALKFPRPLYLLAPPDGSKRLFVIEQAGVIQVFEQDNPKPSVFLDISNRVSRQGNEEGLLGMAFDPQYSQNGYFFIYYSNRSTQHRSIISRFKVSSNDVNRADINSELQIMTVDQHYSNHNGGMIAFGPDGYLYVSLGDGGSGGDPEQHGQNLKTLLGSILRIDVQKTTSSQPYTVPPDNPFVNRADARPEIWAYGLRNVWRFSFDRLLGTLWAGDVGQSSIEEINIIQKGGNYGWRRMEGSQCYQPPSSCQTPDLLLPVVEHDRQDAKSITGGYVYRGKKWPSLYGAYVYGDFVTGKIWAVRYDGQKITEHKLLVDSFQAISSFGEDRDGELYFTSFDGQIYQLEPATPEPGKFPLLLSQTGCFTSFKPLQPAAGLIPYDVNVPLWSDHLEKERWIALPDIAQITYKTADAWEFPEATVIIKHFSFLSVPEDPNSRRFVETRFLVKQNGDWRGYSYLWNREQTDANLLEGNAEVSVTQQHPKAPQPNFSFVHVVPNRSECLQCHTAAAGRVLGLETLQINRDYNYNAVIDNQLRAMQNIKLFTQTLPTDPSQIPRLPMWEDPLAPISTSARAYLHANCAYCHRPGVAGVADTDLRYTQTLSQTATCNVTPQKGDIGVNNAKLLTPGKPEQSIVYLRTKTRSVGQMPPIGTKLEDTKATAILYKWISELRNCSP